MDNKLNFRTKGFIVFMILSFLILIYDLIFRTPSQVSKLPILFSFNNIFIYVLYALTIIFLFKKKFCAWILALIPSLWILFNPMINPVNIPSGTILRLFSNLVDPANARIAIIASIIPIIIIVYCIINLITELKNYENKNLDLIIGIIFIIFASIEISE